MSPFASKLKFELYIIVNSVEFQFSKEKKLPAKKKRKITYAKKTVTKTKDAIVVYKLINLSSILKALYLNRLSIRYFSDITLITNALFVFHSKFEMAQNTIA